MLLRKRLYFACLGLLLCLIASMVYVRKDTQAQTAGMYGPVNLYVDMWWGDDGIAYAQTQTTPSVPYHAHQYKARARIVTPDGSSVEYETPYYFFGATAGASYNFGIVYSDGRFINDGRGSGYCQVAALVFSSSLLSTITDIPKWCKVSMVRYTPRDQLELQQQTNLKMDISGSFSAVNVEIDVSATSIYHTGDTTSETYSVENDGLKKVKLKHGTQAVEFDVKCVRPSNGSVKHNITLGPPTGVATLMPHPVDSSNELRFIR